MKEQQQNNKNKGQIGNKEGMIKLRPTTLITTLSISGLIQTKGTMLSDWILKRVNYMLCIRDPLYFCCCS